MWDIEQDTVHSFDFATGCRTTALDEEDMRNANTQAAEIAGRRAVAQFWDPTEPKLLVCETVQLPGGASGVPDTASKKPIPSGGATEGEQQEVRSDTISLG